MPDHLKSVKTGGPGRVALQAQRVCIADAFPSLGASVIDHESMPWIPLAPYSSDIEVKYLRIDPVRGEMIMLFKASPWARLPRCHHCDGAFVYTVEGRWKQLEQDWIAGPGSLVHIPAATSHTPSVFGQCRSVVALAVVRGDIVMYRDSGAVLAIENWRAAMDRYLAYCHHARITPVDLTAMA